MLWSDISDTGGSPLTSYHLQYKRSTSSTWIDVQGLSPFNTDLEGKVLSGVDSGRDYDFRVRGRNIHGWGEWSSTTTLTASSIPADILTMPSTILVGTKVRIIWIPPLSTGGNGISIDEYKIQIADSSGTYID